MSNMRSMQVGCPLYPQGIKRKVKGDWNCRACNNLNFSYRVCCNVCKIKRPSENPGFDFAVFLNLNAFEEFETWPSHLDSSNLPSLSTLLLEEIYSTPTLARPLTGRQSFSDLSNKRIVDGAKTSTNDSDIEAVLEGVKRPSEERKGDWVCLGCKNLNFSFRRTCNRCNLAKDRYLEYK